MFVIVSQNCEMDIMGVFGPFNTRMEARARADEVLKKEVETYLEDLENQMDEEFVEPTISFEEEDGGWSATMEDPTGSMMIFFVSVQEITQLK